MLTALLKQICMEGVHLCSVLFFSAATAAPKKHCKGGASHFHRGLTGMRGTESYCSRYLSVVLSYWFANLRKLCETLGPDKEGVCSSFGWTKFEIVILKWSTPMLLVSVQVFCV